MGLSSLRMLKMSYLELQALPEGLWGLTGLVDLDLGQVCAWASTRAPERGSVRERVRGEGGLAHLGGCRQRCAGNGGGGRAARRLPSLRSHGPAWRGHSTRPFPLTIHVYAHCYAARPPKPQNMLHAMSPNLSKLTNLQVSASPAWRGAGCKLRRMARPPSLLQRRLAAGLLAGWLAG